MGPVGKAAPGAAAQAPENTKKDNPFKKGLVELRGVAGQRAAAREDHAERGGGYPSVELTVDEVADSAEAKSYRDRDDIEVSGLPELYLFPPAEEISGDNEGQTSPMKGHPAVPGGENFQWMAGVVTPVVQEDVAEPSAEHYRDNENNIEILEVFLKGGKMKLPDLQFDKIICGKEAKDIHQAIPAYAKRAEAEDGGVNLGIVHGSYGQKLFKKMKAPGTIEKSGIFFVTVKYLSAGE